VNRSPPITVILSAWSFRTCICGKREMGPRIELTAEDVPGFWEVNGYHMRGDPWKEQTIRFGLELL